MDRICWSIQDDGAHWGRVGELDLFSVFESPYAGSRYQLHTELPNLWDMRTQHNTEAEAFAHAEEVLTKFLSSIAAKWDDEESK